MFGHFNNVDRREGEYEGNISVYWFEHGWFWMIPLKDGTMSVGAVCRPAYLKQRKGSVAEYLLQTIASGHPEMRHRMRNAVLINNEARATGNYSYQPRGCAASATSWWETPTRSSIRSSPAACCSA
jgi:flavin-dependent dehydrogenase